MTRRPSLKKMARLALPIVPKRSEVRLEIGVIEDKDGTWVGLQVGAERCRLTPERAEEIAVDLRNFALEIRNGGQLT